MKTYLQPKRRLSPARIRLLGALVFSVSIATHAGDTGTAFASPGQAVTALEEAVKSENHDALRSLFGPALADVENPDRIQATNEFVMFAAALEQDHRLVKISEDHLTLNVGTNDWPFPIPIVKGTNGWYFDTAAGKEELLNRRIGRNELAALDTVRAYVDAQREYASRDHDGDEVLEFAQRFSSTPGRHDGLYWPSEEEGETSPLGPLVANAQLEGYDLQSPVEPEPFHGYYFRILTRQGKHAPGGKYSYVINGHMIGGFALVAWPAEYGDSGIMTFIVNQQGRVYQKDLGKNTDRTARRMKSYDPDSSWSLSHD